MVDEDQVEQWHYIHEREEERRGKITELREVIEKEKGRKHKNAKSLLRLLIKAGNLKISDAAQMLGLEPAVINRWARILSSKKLLILEGSINDPTMQPAPEVLDKLNIYQSKKGKEEWKQALNTGIQELQDMKRELLAENKLRTQFEEDLKSKEIRIRELESNLTHEQELKDGLSERVESLESQLKGGSENELKTVKEQLDREHAERLKIEAILEKEREKLEKERIQLEKQYSEKENLLKAKEKDILDKEEMIEEDEELDILFGDDPVEEDIQQNEMRLKDLIKKLHAEEEKLKKGKKPPVKEMEDIARQEEEVAHALESDLKQILKKKALESFVEGLDDDDLSGLSDDDDGDPATAPPLPPTPPGGDEPPEPEEPEPAGPEPEPSKPQVTLPEPPQPEAPEPESPELEASESEPAEPEVAVPRPPKHEASSKGTVVETRKLEVKDTESKANAVTAAEPAAKPPGPVTTPFIAEPPVKPPVAESPAKLPEKAGPIKKPSEDKPAETSKTQPAEDKPAEKKAETTPEKPPVQDATAEQEAKDLKEYPKPENPSRLDLLDLMTYAKEISFDQARKKLGVNEKDLEKWVTDLMEKNVLQT